MVSSQWFMVNEHLTSRVLGAQEQYGVNQKFCSYHISRYIFWTDHSSIIILIYIQGTLPVLLPASGVYVLDTPSINAGNYTQLVQQRVLWKINAVALSNN